MQNKLRFIFVWSLLCCFTLAFANPSPPPVQEPDSLLVPKDWFNLDPDVDGVVGTSSNKAYGSILKGRTPQKTVVVAVIDSGVDIEHEDLEGKIWVNTGEIPGNGIDDDGNGYVDDVNGWNFIGGTDGTNVETDSYELTREYARLEPVYGDADPDNIKRRNREEYDYWLIVKKDLEQKKMEAEMNYKFTADLQTNLVEVAQILKTASGKDDVTVLDLQELKDDDPKVLQAAGLVEQLFANIGGRESGLNAVLEELAKAVEHYGNQVEFAYNPEFDPRHIVGDDPENYRQRIYGNKDVMGPDASHGTHVSGIIAADRANALGMRGVADHVAIMSIRAVPDGDERDKDIASAIYYAVDNGADIINMSFGKSYSPGKKYVDKAVKYARRKGVLLVHAAGNSGEKVNAENNFPNKWLGRRQKQTANWLEVGASAWRMGENLAGSFSNYGQQAVDLFAPGVDVYSTIPGNEYDANSGTSMAAPVVSGVAALIMAYFPELKPSEIIDILRESVYPLGDKMVVKPGGDEMVSFGSLSVTGGVVNAYEALKLAASIED